MFGIWVCVLGGYLYFVVVVVVEDVYESQKGFGYMNRSCPFNM